MAKKKKQSKGAARQPQVTPPKQPALPPSRLAIHKPLYERVLFGLSLLGVLVTVHLNVWYGSGAVVAGGDPVCSADAGFNCLAVLTNDPMVQLLGIPSAVLGLLFYLILAGLSVGILYVSAAQGLLFKKIRAGLIGFGFLMSVFLTLYQFTVLSDRCLLCLISALIVTVMAGVLALYLFKTEAPASRPRQASSVQTGEYKVYGLMAVLLLVSAGVDFGYYRSLVPASSGDGDVMPVAQDRPVNVDLCQYMPDTPFFSNMNTLVTDTDPIVGNPDAPITIFEFLDPNCPHCRSLHPTMKAVKLKYPDQLRVVYKPVAIVGSATHSLDEVHALMLAAEQGKFEEMLELEMVHQSPSTGLSIGRLTEFAEQIGMDASTFRKDLEDKRFAREVRRNRDVYMNLKLTGVPAVILEGRLVFPRSRSVGCLSYFIEQELAAKGLVDEAEPPAAPASAPAEGTAN